MPEELKRPIGQRTRSLRQRGDLMRKAMRRTPNFRIINEIRKLWDEVDLYSEKNYKVIFLDGRGSIIKHKNIDGSRFIDASKILRSADVRSRYNSFVVAHNTDDGNVYPKPGDKEIIRMFVDEGKRLGKPMKDYFILSRGPIYTYTNSIGV